MVASQRESRTAVLQTSGDSGAIQQGARAEKEAGLPMSSQSHCRYSLGTGRSTSGIRISTRAWYKMWSQLLIHLRIGSYLHRVISLSFGRVPSCSSSLHEKGGNIKRWFSMCSHFTWISNVSFQQEKKITFLSKEDVGLIFDSARTSPSMHSDLWLQFYLKYVSPCAWPPFASSIFSLTCLSQHTHVHVFLATVLQHSFFSNSCSYLQTLHTFLLFSLL